MNTFQPYRKSAYNDVSTAFKEFLDQGPDIDQTVWETAAEKFRAGLTPLEKKWMLQPDHDLKDRESFFQAVTFSLRYILEFCLSRASSVEEIIKIKTHHLESFTLESVKIITEGYKKINYYNFLRNILVQELRLHINTVATYSQENCDSEISVNDPDENIFLISKEKADVLGESDFSDEQVAEACFEYDIAEKFQPINILLRELKSALLEAKLSDEQVSEFCYKYFALVNPYILKHFSSDDPHADRISIFLLGLLDNLHSLKVSLDAPRKNGMLGKIVELRLWLNHLSQEAREILLRTKNMKLNGISNTNLDSSKIKPEKKVEEQVEEEEVEVGEISLNLLSWPAVMIMTSNARTIFKKLPVKPIPPKNRHSKFKNGIAIGRLTGDNFDTLMSNSQDSKVETNLVPDHRRRLRRLLLERRISKAERESLAEEHKHQTSKLSIDLADHTSVIIKKPEEDMALLAEPIQNIPHPRNRIPSLPLDIKNLSRATSPILAPPQIAQRSIQGIATQIPLSLIKSNGKRTA